MRSVLAKKDSSLELYNKYFALKNKTIVVTLKDHSVLKGVFMSFFLGDENHREPYIIEWHLTDEKYAMSSGMDAFGFMIGEIIKQEDILEVGFFDDGSLMRF